MLVIFNGQLISESEKIFSSLSRTYRYGDGFFETIRVSGRRALWIDLHTERLIRTSKILKYDWPEKLTDRYLDEAIHNLCWKTGNINARCRITVFREGQGYYSPENPKTNFLIELEPLENQKYSLNEKGLKLGEYGLIQKPSNILSLFKTTSAMPYVLAGMFAAENGVDACILFNDQGRVAEAHNSNIFVVQENDILTPSLSEYCLDGIMRKLIISLAREAGLNVVETALNPDELLYSDEIFLTNAVSGIRWVESFREKNYGYNTAFRLVDLLNSSAGF